MVVIIICIQNKLLQDSLGEENYPLPTQWSCWNCSPDLGDSWMEESAEGLYSLSVSFSHSHMNAHLCRSPGAGIETIIISGQELQSQRSMLLQWNDGKEAATNWNHWSGARKGRERGCSVVGRAGKARQNHSRKQTA